MNTVIPLFWLLVGTTNFNGRGDPDEKLFNMCCDFSFLFISCDEKNERSKTMDITKNKTVIQVLNIIKVARKFSDGVSKTSIGVVYSPAS